MIFDLKDNEGQQSTVQVEVGDMTMALNFVSQAGVPKEIRDNIAHMITECVAQLFPGQKFMIRYAMSVNGGLAGNHGLMN